MFNAELSVFGATVVNDRMHVMWVIISLKIVCRKTINYTENCEGNFKWSGIYKVLTN
jgi:hypothetical protein